MLFNLQLNLENSSLQFKPLSIDFRALLWTPGLGGPDNAAVLAWFGVDLFDTTRTRFALVQITS